MVNVLIDKPGDLPEYSTKAFALMPRVIGSTYIAVFVCPLLCVVEDFLF